jgi:hypothetical protein
MDVTIRKVKLNGTIHTWEARLIDEDAHGMWLFTPQAGPVHNVVDGEEFYKPMGLGTEPGFLWLMPRDEWWFGAWWTRPNWEHVAIVNLDACTPPALIDDIWTWTDLELDICRNHAGEVWVEDEDEFDESIALGLIDEPTQQAARAVTDDMVRRLTERVPPFDDTGWRRYHDLIATSEHL